MIVQKIPYQDTGSYSKIIIDYLNQEKSIQTFTKPLFTSTSAASFIESRKKHPIIDREKLSNIIPQQYDHLEISEKTKANINSLKQENTFTITTAHQLNLFTGPLYFIYKVLHCINLCETLKKELPDYHFVPIFWMHSEDHDIAEINHFHLFNQTITWQTEDKVVSGSLPTGSLKSVIEEVKNLLGESDHAQSMIALLEKCFLKQPTYRKAMFAFVNELFGPYGIVLIDQHNAALKTLIKPLIQSDLLENKLYQTSTQTNETLIKEGYHVQAYPRPINLFYLAENNKRHRIETTDTGFQLVNGNQEFTQQELVDLLETDINRFSTNVLMRPLFQESVLPNLAYIGGGGELAYWMQLKKTFETYDLHYPALMLRNSVMWVDANANKKLHALNMQVQDIFQDTDQLITQYVKKNTDSEVSLTEEKKQLEKLFEPILAKAKAIDVTLEKATLGEMSRQLKSLSNLEAKLLRAEKRNFETQTNQIKGVKSRLFPTNKLQERHDNFMRFWSQKGSTFFDQFLENVNAWNDDFTVLIEE